MTKSLRDSSSRPAEEPPPDFRHPNIRRLATYAILAAAGAALTWGVFSSLMAPPWWYQSGLPADPGNFVRRNAVDYPFCADWSVTTNGQLEERMMADLKRAGAQVTVATTSEPVHPGGRVNLGILLPPGAKIQKVYCASAPVEGPMKATMQECSGARCVPPMSTLVEDSEHRRARALIVTFLNPLPGAPPFNGRLWVVWEKKKAGRGT